MRTETIQRIPPPREQVYNYLVDPRTWIYWMAGILDIADLDLARWKQPGDKVHLGYRLLGRRIETQVELKEIQPTQYVKALATSPIGNVTHEWFYSDAGETSTTLRVIYEADEPNSFFGNIIDRSMAPRTIERDLKATMANLEQIFAMGTPDQPSAGVAKAGFEVSKASLGIRPQVGIIFSINQLCSDTRLGFRFAHRAFQHMTHVKFTRHHSNAHILPLVCK